MVKIMSQFAVNLLSDDADVELVNWCGSMHIRLQNFCKVNGKIFYVNLVFVAESNG